MQYSGTRLRRMPDKLSVGLQDKLHGCKSKVRENRRKERRIAALFFCDKPFGYLLINQRSVDIFSCVCYTQGRTLKRQELIMNIAEKIKSVRMEKNLTQKDLGEALNISDKAVSKWERGVAMPDIALIPKLCKVLEIGMEELLGGEQADEIVEATSAPTKRKWLFLLIPAVAVFIISIIVASAISANILDCVNYNRSPYDFYPDYFIENSTVFFSSEKYDYNTRTTSDIKTKEVKYLEIFTMIDSETIGEGLENREITTEYETYVTLTNEDRIDFKYWYEIDGEIYRSNLDVRLKNFGGLSHEVALYKLSPLSQEIFRYLIK